MEFVTILFSNLDLCLKRERGRDALKNNLVVKVSSVEGDKFLRDDKKDRFISFGVFSAAHSKNVLQLINETKESNIFLSDHF